MWCSRNAANMLILLLILVIIGVAFADHAALVARMEMRCRRYAETVFEVLYDPVLLPGTLPKRFDTCRISTQTTIIGGDNANPQEFPHMALVGYGTQPTFWRCGGSLISELWLLSAAHCITTDMKPEVARLGDLDVLSVEDDAHPATYKIVLSVRHPDYKISEAYNDIALLKLEGPVEFNRFVRPICLHGLPSPNETVIVSGWGATAFGSRGSTILQKANLKVLDNDVCVANFSSNMRAFRRMLPNGLRNESQICAWGDRKDACQGDSGGPLQHVLVDPYCMYNIVGVTSLGSRCGGKRPSIYTRVANYLSWIESIVWPKSDEVQEGATGKNTTVTVEETRKTASESEDDIETKD